jgi:hypothetical protein
MNDVLLESSPTHMPSWLDKPVNSMLRVLAVLLVASGLAEAELLIHHQSSTIAGQQSLIRPFLVIENTEAVPVELSGGSLRYCLQEDINPADLAVECWYAANASCQQIRFTTEAVAISFPNGTSANICVNISFPNATIPGKGQQVIQWGIHDKNWSHRFDEFDDPSYTSGNVSWNPAPAEIAPRSPVTPSGRGSLEERAARLEALITTLSRALSISEQGKVSLSSPDSIILRSEKALVMRSRDVSANSRSNVSLQARRDASIHSAGFLRYDAGVSYRSLATMNNLEATAILQFNSPMFINHSPIVYDDRANGRNIIVQGEGSAASFYTHCGWIPGVPPIWSCWY